MNYIIKKVGSCILSIIWPKYMRTGNPHSGQLVFVHWMLQKVFRINAHVDWPVHPTSKIKMPENIQRGTRTPGLAVGCYIDGRNGIEFGQNVWVGPYVSIISMNHDVNDYHCYIYCRPIVIGDHCWLGARSIILPGVELGKHTVVAAGAVVTHSFPDGDQILAGIPAKVVKKLNVYSPNSNYGRCHV